MTDRSATDRAPRPARRAWTVVVATFSARHRWPVLILWFVFTGGLFGLSQAMGGTAAQNAVLNNDRVPSESRVANSTWNAANVRPDAPPVPASQTLLVLVSSDTAKVTDPAYQATVKDVISRLGGVRTTIDGQEVPSVTSIVDPFTAPPAAGLVSEDLSTVRIVGTVLGSGTQVDDRVAPLPALFAQLRVDHPGYRVHSLNSSLANAEISEMVSTDLDGSLRLTIPITFVILVLAFGTVVAAFVPLILAVASLVGAFGFLAIYSQLVSPVSPYANQLIVLIGLAVAVDYSLFLLTRFRSERRRGKTRDEAIEIAASTAGRAVFFSGLAVMISIAGLFFLDDSFFRSMALGTIAVVFISVVGSLTFLPAVLAILDMKIDRLRLRIPGRHPHEGLGLWAVLVRFAMRHAVPVVLVSAVVLLAVASPVTRLHLGQTDLESFPDTLDAVQARNLLSEKWPQGTTLNLTVVVTGADRAETRDAVAKLPAELAALKGLTGPGTTQTSVDGKVARVILTMSGEPNDLANRALVQDVRGRIVPAVFGALPDVHAYVGGDAAFVLDTVKFYEEGLPKVVAFVLILSFLLLLLVFHSIVIPIKAILLNLISTATAFGVLVLVFQDGNLAQQLDFKAGPIESFVPAFVFTILFGLSMDYEVFILSRIQEARSAGLESSAAVERGISITAGTITSAAAIMVAVFAVFVTLRLVIIRELGLGLAVAVLVDATIIRSLLLPATMRLLGDWNWWIPRFLDWIPRVNIEGTPEDQEPEPEPA